MIETTRIIVRGRCGGIDDDLSNFFIVDVVPLLTGSTPHRALNLRMREGVPQAVVPVAGISQAVVSLAGVPLVTVPLTGVPLARFDVGPPLSSIIFVPGSSVSHAANYCRTTKLSVETDSGPKVRREFHVSDTDVITLTQSWPGVHY